MHSFTQPDKPDFDKILGRKLRLQRIRHAMTQRKLAEMLSVSFQQVQKYEAGVNALSAERLWQLSKVFGVAMSYWFTGEDGLGYEGREGGDISTDRRAVHMMHYFSRIEDETVKNLLLAFGRALAGKSHHHLSGS